jgi:alcohol dehydrogenase class IV
LTGRTNARAEDAVDWLLELSTALRIPSLESYGIRRNHFDGIVQKATVATSMQGNPIVLEQDELYAILDSAF